MNLRDLEEKLFKVDHDSMTVHELHGYLSAIIIGPEVIQPSIWLPFVFNSEGEMPEFSSIEEANNVCGAVMYFHNQIIHDMDSEEYIPIFPIKRKNNKDIPDPELWCLSFAEGVSLTQDAWFSEDDEVLATLTLPIYYFVDPEGFSQISRNTSGRKRRGFDQEMMSLIPKSVISIRNYWRKKIYGSVKPGKIGRVIPFDKTRSDETGRNDPCPCGSGKKYKLCCGRK